MTQGEHDRSRWAPSGRAQGGIVPALTRREHEILRLVAGGATNREIAGALGLAPNTVKTYWQQTLVKLGARNRAHAVAKAHELGLL